LTDTIVPEHIMASGALPPGFPAIEIEGEHYWDGGLVSNTPLQWVVDSQPRLDTLAFQVSGAAAVPGPIAGAGLPGILFAGCFLFRWFRKHRKGNAAVASA
jgi:predicted acylesterase/phospholipase RssA